jgi:hypothetical protein
MTGSYNASKNSAIESTIEVAREKEREKRIEVGRERERKKFTLLLLIIKTSSHMLPIVHP